MLTGGIDEAGYGPRLGPLVIAATYIRYDRPRTPCPVPVGDSKKLYSRARGIAAMERSVLAFAGQVLPLPGLTYRGLRGHAAGPAPELPWYGDFPLPWGAREVPVTSVRAWLGGREFGFAARVVEPEAINGSANKADLLFRETAALMREVLERFPDEPTAFRIGKQGGRRYYRSMLARAFGVPFRRLKEEPATSSYSARLDGRRVRCAFLRDGEERDFFVALSSMFGKYLREGAMRLFNEYWAKKIRGLAPTAGYPNDAGRFYRAIRPRLKRLKLPPSLVLRDR
ncbi:MAG: hypothetical protein ACYTAF_06140 [Planctomycetota bacterium]|jgi:hypothetical protein